jgi:hypothetical protein
MSASARWKPSHLTANTRRSRSMHEFTPSPTAEQSMSPLPMDIASVHHHLASGGNSPHPSSPASHHHHSAHQPHQMGFGDPTSAAMVGLGIDDHDYSLPLHHGHPQAMASNVRGTLANDPHRQAPRSVPQGLSLSIPGNGQQQWTGAGAGSSEGAHSSGSGMQLPPGYHDEHGHHGYY